MKTWTDWCKSQNHFVWFEEQSQEDTMYRYYVVHAVSNQNDPTFSASLEQLLGGYELQKLISISLSI